MKSENRVFLSVCAGLAVLVVGLASVGCASAGVAQAKSGLPRETSVLVPDADQAELVQGRQAFALALYHELAGQDGNQVMSPYSVSLALSMVYGGARGETATQMSDVLHFTLPPERLHPAANSLDQLLAARAKSDDPAQPYFELSVANGLWAQKDYTLAPDYLDLLAQDYGAGVYQVDFVAQPEPARVAVNQWVSQQTHDKIKDLFLPGSFSPLTRLVLANAVYFHGSWADSFDKDLTKNDTFTRLDGSTVSVPMMHAEHLYAGHSVGQGYEALSLPYKGEADSLAMLVLMPDAGTFDDFEAGLDGPQFARIVTGLTTRNLELVMPKFEFDSGFSLADTLAAMGMPDAFDKDRADFSGMPADGARELVISKVIHKAFISVSEEGTEAAAATGVEMQLTSAMQPETLTVRIDKPFLFAIYDRGTGEILFLGRVLNPAG